MEAKMHILSVGNANLSNLLRDKQAELDQISDPRQHRELKFLLDEMDDNLSIAEKEKDEQYK